MKIFAVRDESAETQKDLAYLLYYEIEKRFFIELPDNADLWETPLLLDSFVKRGEKTVNSYWSRIWVEQRIIPPDRQNLGEILRDNGLKEYDEYELLMLAMGRCAQDNYYLVPLTENDLPRNILKRFETLIEDVLVLEGFSLLIFFRNGVVRKCDLRSYFENTASFNILLKRPEYFETVQIQTGGHAVAWDVNLTITAGALYRMGKKVPLSLTDFKNFAAQRLVNASEAAEILNCSRQNIMDLTRRGKLHPVKSSDKNTLYLKSEVQQRNWQ